MRGSHGHGRSHGFVQQDRISALLSQSPSSSSPNSSLFEKSQASHGLGSPSRISDGSPVSSPRAAGRESHWAVTPTTREHGRDLATVTHPWRPAQASAWDRLKQAEAATEAARSDAEHWKQAAETWKQEAAEAQEAKAQAEADVAKAHAQLAGTRAEAADASQTDAPLSSRQYLRQVSLRRPLELFPPPLVRSPARGLGRVHSPVRPPSGPLSRAPARGLGRFASKAEAIACARCARTGVSPRGATVHSDRHG